MLASEWLSSYLDAPRRRIFLHGEIDEPRSAAAAQALLLLDAAGAEPITLYLSSCGGDEYEMFGLFDLIVSRRSRVVVVAYGKLMSAAPLILRAADDALAFPNTLFMAHESSWGEHKGHSRQRVDLKHFDDVERRWARLLGERTKLPAATWLRMAKTGKDRYFDAEQALTWGLIDGIIHERTNIQRRVT